MVESATGSRSNQPINLSLAGKLIDSSTEGLPPGKGPRTASMPSMDLNLVEALLSGHAKVSNRNARQYLEA